jgi:cytochrome b561
MVAMTIPKSHGSKMESRHPSSAMFFHWSVAATIALLAATGATMTRLAPGSEAQFALYQIHKAAGIATLLLSLVRLIWRPFAPPLPPIAAAPGLRRAARIVHVALFALTLVVPFAGWALVSASRLDIPIELVAGLAWPRLPGLVDLPPAAKARWEPVLASLHVALAYALVGLAALHAAAAIFHHAIRGDATLRRMLPFAILLAMVAAASTASAREWTVDRERSSLGFAGTETGNRFQGRFARWSARIAFDPARPEDARLEVEVDIASATTGEPRRDAAMLGDEWLDAAGFPRAVFVAQGFNPLGDGRYEAAGTLALRDQRRPVLLRFTLAETPEGKIARGGATLIRTAFGIGRGRWSGLQVVAAEVAVEFDLLARPGQ